MDEHEHTTKDLTNCVVDKFGGNTRFAIENHETRTTDLPADPDENDPTEKLLHDAEMKEIVKEKANEKRTWNPHAAPSGSMHCQCAG